MPATSGSHTSELSVASGPLQFSHPEKGAKRLPAKVLPPADTPYTHSPRGDVGNKSLSQHLINVVFKLLFSVWSQMKILLVFSL